MESPQSEIQKIKGVQRRTLRIAIGFETLEYEERLKRLCLASFKDRRLRGDLIEMYKVMSS